MATRLTLVDDDGNALECFLNNNNTVQVNVSTDSDEFLSTASISLHKEHVQKLIKILTETLGTMENTIAPNESVLVQ